MLTKRRFLVVILIFHFVICALDAKRAGGGFGRSRIGYNSRRRPSSYNTRYGSKGRKTEYGSDTKITEPKTKPSAPPMPVENRRPIGWNTDTAAGKNIYPAHTQPKAPQGHLNPDGSHIGKQPHQYPVTPSSVKTNLAKPGVNEPPPPYSATNNQGYGYGKAAPPPPYSAVNNQGYGQQAPPPYSPVGGYGYGNGQPPPPYTPMGQAPISPGVGTSPSRGYGGYGGLGGLAGSGLVGNVLSGLTLWQLMRGAGRGNYNVHNHYYQNQTGPEEGPVNGTMPIWNQTMPINGTDPFWNQTALNSTLVNDTITSSATPISNFSKNPVTE